LYRIVLTKATKLDFDLQVLDWNAEEAEIEHPDVPLNLPKNVQDSLNRQLLVYDLFTEFDVNELDLTNAKVKSFYTSLPEVDTDVSELSTFITYKSLKDNNLLEDGALITDNSGNEYRVPTAGELQLITTAYSGFLQSPVKDNYIYHVSWGAYTTGSSSMYSAIEFEEFVYLKNNANLTPNSSVDVSEESEFGFKGKSILKRGRITDTIYANTNGQKIELTPGDITYQVCPIYGIRFKGTKQYSAYKWESLATNGDRSRRYISVKIKALPEDADITIDDIVDNHSYWNDEDCIEIILATRGRGNPYANPKRIDHIDWCCLLSSSSVDSSNFYLLFGTPYDCAVNSAPSTNYYKLRLVKVKASEKEE
ncbi:MAG: hypothetical protein K2M68_05525, partial [Muribaculaceae bacterium]|nr:hypothetical protein [Muribaculaceae bacterium]